MPTLGRERRNEHVPDETTGANESGTTEILNEKNWSSATSANRFLRLLPGAKASPALRQEEKYQPLLPNLHLCWALYGHEADREESSGP